ncbi:MAG: hypothetical protein VX899_23560 [Myxococcota bacterium]|nr:hypothetical protein [Myxococcota bacterium]
MYISPKALGIAAVTFVLGAGVGALLVASPAQAGDQKEAVCHSRFGGLSLEKQEANISGWMTEQIGQGRSKFVYTPMGEFTTLCAW